MRKSLAFSLLTVMVLSASTGAMAANNSDNKVVAGCKKVAVAVCWPFKKIGQGCKAVGHKITGK